VEQLYPKKADMDRWVKEGEERFVRALEKVVGPFLQLEEDSMRPIREFPEPVGEAARAYLLVDLNAAMVARELGLEKPEDLLAALKGNARLRELGLLPLVNGKEIKREDWDVVVGGTSLFQDVARLLGLGEPPLRDLK
jgi:hypothetical protein